MERREGKTSQWMKKGILMLKNPPPLKVRVIQPAQFPFTCSLTIISENHVIICKYVANKLT